MDHRADALFDAGIVDEALKDAAESVRAHLCALRGGAPFLSSSDAMQLLRWFEDGVSTTAILLALERAADARRRRRSKVPLRLSHARRHLGRPTRAHRPTAVVRPVSADDGPFAPVVAMLDPRDPAEAELAGALRAVSGRGEPAVTAALACVRAFVDRTWRALGDEGQSALLREAERQLGDLLADVDETTGAALLEETARDLHRSRWPGLSAATLWDCVEQG